MSQIKHSFELISTGTIIEAVRDPAETRVVLKCGFCMAKTKNLPSFKYNDTELRKAAQSMQRHIDLHGPILGEKGDRIQYRADFNNISHAVTQVKKCLIYGSPGFRADIEILPTPVGDTIRIVLIEGFKPKGVARIYGELDKKTNTLKKSFIKTIDLAFYPDADDRPA